MNNTNAEIQCYVEELLVDLDDTAYFKIPGEKGDTGDPGHSPVVTATKSGKTTTISVDGAAIATVEDGADGKPGTAGADGVTPHIGDNGNWYLGEEDTGKPSRGATGTPGAAGHSPVVTATKSGKTTTISVDGAAIATVEDGSDGAPGSRGADGITPTIGANGNWYLGEEDTGKPSRGAIGAPGKDGNPGAPGKDGAGMDITGATVGQIAKITAVDASGVPTAWSPADMPSGGSHDAVLYTAQELTYGQKFQARKNIEAADRVMPTITGGVSLCPANVTDSNTAVHTTTTTSGGDDFTLTLDGGPENALVRVKGIRTPTDTDTNAAANVEYVKAAIPTALKNPNALTIKIGSTTVTYDGSTAQTVTIADGSEVSY